MGSTRFSRFAHSTFRLLCFSCVRRGEVDSGNMFIAGSEMRHGVCFLYRELQEERGRSGCVDGARGD
jgi:hypothetical protein